MKKKIALCFTLFFVTVLLAQQHSITISGPSSVEVGVPNNYTFQFNHVYPQNSAGVLADAYIITEWIVLTGTNGLSGSIPGYINTPSNQSSYYYDGTYNNSNPKTVAIQWGDGTYTSSDNVTVKVSGIYIKSSTGEHIGYFNYQPQETQAVTVQRLIEPVISGASSVQDCDQTNTTFSISNQTNGNQFLWSATNGASVVGSATGSTVTIKPPLSGSFNVFCSVKRSGANTNYSVSGSKYIVRNSYTSSATISGNTTICSTQNYSMSGLLAGESVTWSLSNTTSGTLSTTTGTSTTITKTGGGSVVLTATILNSCGTQSTTKTKKLFAGSPPNFGLISGLFENQSCDTKYHYVPFIFNKPVGTTLSFPFLYPNVTYNSVYNGNDEYIYTFAFLKGYSGYFNMYAVLTNSCGSSNYETEGEFYIQSCSEIQAMSNTSNSNLDNNFIVYPNPAIDVLNIQLISKNNETIKLNEISAQLFDMMGVKKASVKFFDVSASINTGNLPKGIYILNIYIGDTHENHQIIIE